MTTQELFEKINEAFEEFGTQHTATTKISNTRARKALSEITKLAKDYRKQSLLENK